MIILIYRERNFSIRFNEKKFLVRKLKGKKTKKEKNLMYNKKFNEDLNAI